MKISNWINTGIYKYFFSGISKSDEIISLGLPKNITTNLSIFGYISGLEWVENIMSIKLEKKILTDDSFKFIINTEYGYKQYGDEVFKSDGIGPADSSNYSVIHYYNGKGFNINMFMNGLGTNTAGGSFYYRYKKIDGNFTEWILLLDYYHPGSLQETPVNKIELIDIDDIYPITDSTNIEIKVNLWRGGRYSGAYYEYTITPFNYIPLTDNTKGTIHWFAFAK